MLIQHFPERLFTWPGIRTPKVISEQLGHASVAFTLDVYSHVLPHMQDAAAERVQALLLNASVPS